MDLKKDYNTLYQHWLKEFEQAGLTSLALDDFNKYKNVLASINTFQVDKADKIKHQLSESYKKNIEFLFNDLLKIREIKILNAALANQEINLEHVVEAEKLLYQNLISTFKGYKKVKNLLLIGEQYSLDREITVREEKAILTEDSKSEKAKEIGLKDEEQPKGEKYKEEIEYNYTLIRFLKKTPPLVGIDLLNYGPFEENDVANLPYKNALILINEKFAEQLDVS
jgi:DNA replication initiation complex subunit (GINS family)